MNVNCSNLEMWKINICMSYIFIVAQQFWSTLQILLNMYACILCFFFFIWEGDCFLLHKICNILKATSKIALIICKNYTKIISILFYDVNSYSEITTDSYFLNTVFHGAERKCTIVSQCLTILPRACFLQRMKYCYVQVLSDQASRITPAKLRVLIFRMLLFTFFVPVNLKQIRKSVLYYNHAFFAMLQLFFIYKNVFFFN